MPSVTPQGNLAAWQIQRGPVDDGTWWLYRRGLRRSGPRRAENVRSDVSLMAVGSIEAMRAVIRLYDPEARHLTNTGGGEVWL